MRMQKMSEWNLSDKLYHASHPEEAMQLVREFLRRLKEDFTKRWHNNNTKPEDDLVYVMKKIDKLAGEKLIVPQEVDAKGAIKMLSEPEGVDVVKFRMVPWDKHGNKPKDDVCECGHEAICHGRKGKSKCSYGYKKEECKCEKFKPKEEDVIEKKARDWVKKIDDEVYKTLTEKKLK